MHAGTVDIHTHGIYAADHDIIQGLLECGLVDIVLVLSHPNGFGIDFYQFRKGVDQPPGNGDGPANGEVQVGKFFTRSRRCGIYRCAAFIDRHHLNGVAKCKLADERLGLSAGCPVAHRDGFNLEALHELTDFVGSLPALVL